MSDFRDKTDPNDDADLLWKVLADRTRRAVLDLLVERPRTTGELCEAFPHLTRFAVMKHVGLLESCHLVVVRREGKFRWNHLNPIPLQRIHNRWVTPTAARWATPLLDLERHLGDQLQGEDEE